MFTVIVGSLVLVVGYADLAEGTSNKVDRGNAVEPFAGDVLYTVIYHFDGLTYHPLSNRGEHFTQDANCRSSFDTDAMRQLVVWQKKL